MQLIDVSKPLIVLIGSTAVGKTHVSIQLAERLNGDIVSADSRLFYRGMDIGTAKPGESERQRVRHHLIDICNPDQSWSLAEFQDAAHKAIFEIHKRNKIPFLVGGTGQYIRAVIEGWQPPPGNPNLGLREVLRKWGLEIGAEELHQKLAIIDPLAAAKIQPRNLRRTIRALEVILETGKTFSSQKQIIPSRYSLLIVGLKLPRPVLYQRIDERIGTMFKNGFIDEVRGLLAKGFSPELPSLSAIGYREVIAYLQGKITLEQAVSLMKKTTRQYVRRQANWFKETDRNIHWFQINDQAVDTIQEFILTTNDWIIPEEEVASE